MPLTFNGNTPSAVTYNGNSVSEVTYNGVTVWQAAGSSASEFDFTLDSSHLTLDLYLTQSAANAVTIDWGDNSATESPSSTSASLTHTYSAAGNYTVSITCESGESWYPGGYFPDLADDFSFCGVADSQPRTTLTAIRAGSGMYLFAPNCFEMYTALVTAVLSAITSGTIPEYAFGMCSALPNVSLGNGITAIGDHAFRQCNLLTSISIPSTVTSIGTYAFYNCGLTSIVIPDSVITISDHAFRGNGSMLSVDIGAGVTSVGAYGFGSCSNLESITCRATAPPTLGSNALRSVPANCAIYVPSGSVAAYQAANIWSSRAAYIQAIP